MRSLDFIKTFSFLALILLLFPSCRNGQNTEVETSDPKPFVAEEFKSEIPFSTTEPEIFQAEIVISAGGRERVYFIARNGADRRYDYDFAGKNRVSFLLTDKTYLVFPGKKIYTENTNGETAADSENQIEFLTTEWLNQRIETGYEQLETENNTTKYRVRFAENESSESLIYIDETRKLPVRQEFYSINGEQRILTYSVELRNLKLQTDVDAFAIPKDFRKVSSAEFRKISRNDSM